MPRRRTVAVFDIDGTIFRSSLIIEVFNALVAAGVFPKKASAEVEKKYLAWLDRKGHYNDYLMRLVFAYYRYLPGMETRKLDPIITKVIAWQKDRVYRYTRDLARRLRAQGHLLIAISNSQHAMVERFASAQGFDIAIGRELQIVNGKYTGKVLYNGNVFPIKAHLDKVAILNHCLADHGVEADLARSYAVGDSEGDIPLLSAVGRPIAFNPSLPLARHAKRHGWQIVVERKDVIYKIHDTEFIPHDEHQVITIPYGSRRSRGSRA